MSRKPITKPFAAFVRSSDGVAERQREGIYHADQDQIEEVERYANDLGLRLVWLPPELDMSGGLPIEKRPSLKAAIEGVEAGKYAGIITANLKRLTRSRSGHQIWERVEAAGGQVHTARERLDTTSPHARRTRDYAIADAVMEREEHSEQHARRRQKTVEAGMWRTRQPPRGYRFAGPPNADGNFRGKARRLVKDRRARGVRDGFIEFAAGITSISALADRWAMTPGGVRGILRNRVYLGEVRDGGVLNRETGKRSPLHVKKDAHDAIIDEETFEAVQVRLRTKARPTRSPRAVALLAGLVRCAGCGHVMSRNGATYACPKRHSGRQCPAPAAIQTHALDDYVLPIAETRAAHLRARGESGWQIEKARAASIAMRAERTAFLQKTLPSDPSYDEGRAIWNARVEEADAALAAAQDQAPLSVHYDGRKALRDMDPEGANQLLRALLSAVVVRAAGRGRRVAVADRVRIVKFGADIGLPKRVHGAASGIVSVDLDSPDVLGVSLTEQAPQDAGGVDQVGLAA